MWHTLRTLQSTSAEAVLQLVYEALGLISRAWNPMQMAQRRYRGTRAFPNTTGGTRCHGCSVFLRSSPGHRTPPKRTASKSPGMQSTATDKLILRSNTLLISQVPTKLSDKRWRQGLSDKSSRHRWRFKLQELTGPKSSSSTSYNCLVAGNLRMAHPGHLTAHVCSVPRTLAPFPQFFFLFRSRGP